MGKKSKRRTGKRSLKKAEEGAITGDKVAAPGTEDVVLRMDHKLSIENESDDSSIEENVKPAGLSTGHQNDSKKSNENSFDTEDFEDEFIEFMLWTLCDNKADLTPKKFAKSSPRLAMKLIASDVSIQEILEKRNEMIRKIEKQIQDIESGFIDSLQLKVAFHNLDLETALRNTIIDFAGELEKEKIVVLQKYYMHPTAREEFLKGNDYVQKILFFVLSLYEEMHKCWRCNQLHGKGIQTKSLICAGCKCVVYCSKDCQLEHWKAGRHQECCEDLGTIWSKYEERKRRAGRAMKDKRVYTKPIIVDGIEKECFLRPCEPLDYLLCRTSLQNVDNVTSASMDTYYENIARLACGGKHPIFGEDTISSQLEEKIRSGYENASSEFDPKSLGKDEVFAMKSIVEALLYDEVDLPKREDLPNIQSDISVERFLTLYTFIESISGGKAPCNNLGKQISFWTMNKFDIETSFIQGLKNAHDKTE